MKINVRVVPNSSMTMVQSEPDGSIKVKLTARPEKGKANEQLVGVLAKHYNVNKSKVRILKGMASKDKIVEVLV
jgi:uncharacterized protein (TIGR00251 family)